MTIYLLNIYIVRNLALFGFQLTPKALSYLAALYDVTTRPNTPEMRRKLPRESARRTLRIDLASLREALIK